MKVKTLEIGEANRKELYVSVPDLIKFLADNPEAVKLLRKVEQARPTSVVTALHLTVDGREV